MSSPRAFFTLAVAVLVGAGLGLASLSVGARYLPSEIGRLRVIGAALDTAAAGPDVLVLGSSVVMNGVDGAAVADALPGDPVVWNASSSGQSLLESALILERAGGAPPVVVVSALPEELVRPALTIRLNKVAAYRLYGYRPSPALRAAVLAGGDTTLADWLGASDARIAARGRWLLRDALDAGLRRVLRPDLAADRVARDLSYPARYTRPVPDAVLEILLQRRFRPRRAEAAALPARVVGALRHLAEAADGSCAVLLVLPEHPRRRETTAPAFYTRLGADLAALEAAVGLRVLDLSALITDPAAFNDPTHPGAAGAAALSRALGEALPTICPETTR